MTSALEATMLICFGFSWPINLIKNIKAQTAKSMSLKFLLLIIFGYLAGITAKLINHNINYVLIIYFLNLAIVSVNLVVYFINKKKDRKRASLGINIVEDITEPIEEKAIKFEEPETPCSIDFYTAMNM